MRRKRKLTRRRRSLGEVSLLPTALRGRRALQHDAICLRRSCRTLTSLCPSVCTADFSPHHVSWPPASTRPFTIATPFPARGVARCFTPTTTGVPALYPSDVLLHVGGHGRARDDQPDAAGADPQVQLVQEGRFWCTVVGVRACVCLR